MTKYPLASSTWDDREINAIEGVIKKDIYTMGIMLQISKRTLHHI